MKESPHITLTKEQEKRDTIHCAMWASVVVFGMLALLFHGLAFLSWTEPTMEEIYARRRMKSGIKIIQNQIEDLSLRQKIIEAHAISVMAADNQEKIEHDTHKHHFWTGKVKQEKKFLKTTGSSTQDIWYDNAKITQGTLR